LGGIKYAVPGNLYLELLKDQGDKYSLDLAGYVGLYLKAERV